MIETYEDYLNGLNEFEKSWQIDFDNYIKEKYPFLNITMFRQRPMYKFFDSYLKGYIMFVANKGHFTMHIIDFDLVEQMKTRLPKAKFGKGSIKINYKNVEAVPLLKELCDQVISRYFKK